VSQRLLLGRRELLEPRFHRIPTAEQTMLSLPASRTRRIGGRVVQRPDLLRQPQQEVPFSFGEPIDIEDVVTAAVQPRAVAWTVELALKPGEAGGDSD
jgi:hypothetical protein